MAVIGGGSTYTPELAEGFLAFGDRLPVDDLVLHDIAAPRLDVVGAFAERMLARRGWTGSLRTTLVLEDALDGADFVLFQLRVGGQDARHSDETLPLAHDSVGQETTGAGGFAKALRTVPVVLDVAEEIRNRAAPGAWIVDFTNPVGIVTQALLDEGHRAIGLCNVAIGFQRRFARLLGVAADAVALEHVGLNHLSWEMAVRVDGTDRLPELLEQHGEALAADVGLPVDLLRDLRAVPSYYLRYYYRPDVVLTEQRREPSRAQQVKGIEQKLLERYQDPTLQQQPEELSKRGGAFYSLAAVQLMASLHDGAGDVQVVDIRNNGALQGLPDDAVVEIPARVDRDGASAIDLPAVPSEVLGLIQQVKAYEQLASHAARTGDRRAARLALLANPLVGSYDTANNLLDAILEANRDWLPRFSPSRV